MKNLAHSILATSSFLLMTVLMLNSCAVPCPPDKKVASVEFSPSMFTWVPDEKTYKTQVFTSNKGKTITFKTDENKFFNRGRLDVEVLCSRGDFLDRTSQTRYIDTPNHLLYYIGSDQNYSLQYRGVVQNAAEMTGIKDTVLYENFEVWVQRAGENSASGYLNVFPSFRGNEKSPKINQSIKDIENATFMKSVVVGGKELTDVYMNSMSSGIQIFYKRKLGMVAFKDGDEIWLKK